MARKLKVFRTPIGFHDAYVAAPSQKAALEAWGSDADLFARGMAELVSDETLTKEALKEPGKVFRRLRGSADEHMDELARQAPPRTRASAKAKRPQSSPASRAPSVKRAKRRPAPSRMNLDRAEQAVKEAQAQHARAVEELRAREKALHEERRSLEQKHERDIAKAEQAALKARKTYETALEKWRDE